MRFPSISNPVSSNQPEFKWYGITLRTTLSKFKLLFSPAFGLIRLPCPSVRLVDNSRTERVRGLKFGMCTTYTK
jgi:hypothetical protein